MKEKHKCIYEEKGCNKVRETCKRESCAYAKYFDWLGENFSGEHKECEYRHTGCDAYEENCETATCKYFSRFEILTKELKIIDKALLKEGMIMEQMLVDAGL